MCWTEQARSIFGIELFELFDSNWEPNLMKILTERYNPRLLISWLSCVICNGSCSVYYFDWTPRRPTYVSDRARTYTTYVDVMVYLPLLNAKHFYFVCPRKRGRLHLFKQRLDWWNSILNLLLLFRGIFLQMYFLQCGKQCLEIIPWKFDYS